MFRNTWIQIFFGFYFLIYFDVHLQENSVLYSITPYAEYKYFRWEEYNDDQKVLLFEDGYLPQLGVFQEIVVGTRSRFYSNIDANIYYGIVDYDGFVTDDNGNAEDYLSDTRYFGGNIIAGFGYEFRVSDFFSLAPDLKFGLAHWERSIDYSKDQYGYDEYYTIFDIQLGVKSKIYFTERTNLAFLLAVDIPLSIIETIDFDRLNNPNIAGEMDLEPGSSAGFIFKTDFTIHNFILCSYIDYDLLLKSEEGFNNFYQPESARLLVGMRLGYSF